MKERKSLNDLKHKALKKKDSYVGGDIDRPKIPPRRFPPVKK